MSVEGVQAAEAMAVSVLEQTAPFSNWFIPPGTLSQKNCVVIACKSCDSETFVLKRRHAVSYMCSNCVQANSYA